MLVTGWYVDIWVMEERRMPTLTPTLAKEVVQLLWMTFAALALSQHWRFAHTVAGWATTVTMEKTPVSVVAHQVNIDR